MASGQDPLADMQNLMGYAGLVGPNPYLKYQGQIPIAGYYTGYNDTAVLPGGSGYMPPTNAQGNEIPRYETEQTAANNLYQQQLAAYNAANPAPTPGTTINSSPVAQQYPAGSLGATPAIQELLGNYAASQAALSPQQLAIQQQNNAARQQMLQQQSYLTASANQGGGFGQSPGGAFNPGQGYTPSMMGMMGAGAGAPAAAARPPPPTPPNMRQIYLDALANPGPVQQYGAQPPQAGQTPTGSPGPNVMSAFLAANAGKSTPFIDTLKGIQGAA